MTYILSWLGATLAIVGLIYLLYFVFGKKFAKKGKDLEVLEMLQLGTRQGVYLVRIKDRILALGITATEIRVLSEFSEADSTEEMQTRDQSKKKEGKQFKIE